MKSNKGKENKGRPLSNEQIELLKGKCPECEGHDMTIDGYPQFCLICQDTGKVTIEIEKDWVECPNINCSVHFKGFPNIALCKVCHGKGKIPKYKVGEDIHLMYCGECGNIDESHTAYCVTHARSLHGMHKLKIISETRNKWRVMLV